MTRTSTPKPILKNSSPVKNFNRPTQDPTFFTSTPMPPLKEAPLYVFVKGSEVVGVSTYKPSEGLIRDSQVKWIKVSLSNYTKKLQGVNYGSWTELCQTGMEYSK